MARSVTALKMARREARLTQEQMAEATGISLNTYRRIERGENDNPRIRELTNCALVLGVPLRRVLEPEWLEWTKFGKSQLEMRDFDRPNKPVKLQ